MNECTRKKQLAIQKQAEELKEKNYLKMNKIHYMRELAEQKVE